ncbi:probable DnaJ homolog subfamily C member 24 [Coccomyxa sp. Obi]|nr:probable DnaJ homolog subfamily C member 24 [Coccomyxa sp. Obi]
MPAWSCEMAGEEQDNVNHYQALNVAPDATMDEIRAAYRAAILHLHPDKAGPGSGHKEWQSTAVFMRVQQAWEVLKDAETRTAYNQVLMAKALQKEIAVSAEVDLDDMASHTDATGEMCLFTYPCRCGSNFAVSEAELSEHADNVVVQCQDCSLAIRVLYTVHPENGL